MITVPAHRVRQFGVEFYQACFSAAAIDQLVRFEVLSYESGEPSARPARRKKTVSRINWELLEKRIASSEAAFQRPIIRKKIAELRDYYGACRDSQNLPAIPGAVIMIAERRLAFSRSGPAATGILEIPEEPGILRALDGQHRLLALHAAAASDLLAIDVPAVVFDSLDPRQIVELFVTINAKHTKLNPSHILSLSGRRIYADPEQALAHDIIRRLSEEQGSALRGEIKILGVGKGRVSQAPLNEEMVDLFAQIRNLGGEARAREFREQGVRFFSNYFKAIEVTFRRAWVGRKYSIKTGAALRAFIRAVPDVMEAARAIKGDPYDFHAIRQAVAPWGDHLGDERFETEEQWKSRLGGGTRGTVDILVRELKDALRHR